jgi:hypothetical protein
MMTELKIRTTCNPFLILKKTTAGGYTTRPHRLDDVDNLIIGR